MTYPQWLDKVDDYGGIAPVVAGGRAISRSDYAQLIHVGGVK